MDTELEPAPNVSIVEFARQNGNLTKMFSMLKPCTRAPMSEAELHDLAWYFRRKDEGLSFGKNVVADDAVYVGGYRCYMDWFTRQIRPEVLESLKGKALRRDRFSMPVECMIESIGLVGDPSSIVRLKKPADYVNEELIGEGIPPTHIFVNLKLLTSHYHHVHSPCSGTIKRIMPVPKERRIFGAASLTYVVIDTPYGDVALMIVGEAVVQDFALAVKVGQHVEPLDRIGNFVWGSQVVLLFPGDLAKLIARRRKYYFVGDSVLRA